MNRPAILPFLVRPIVLAAVLPALAPELAAADSEFVVVSATAAPDYVRTTPGRPGLRPESYVFATGHHFLGNTRDDTAENLPFERIAAMLARGLAKQDYFPAKDPALADLIVVVHWGATQIYEKPDEQTNLERLNEAWAAYRSAVAENGIADPGAVNQELAAREDAASLQEQFIAMNAQLLGYRRTLDREMRRMSASEEEKTMRLELAAERYFVVVMAYDYQALKRERKSRLRWVTRFSVRSPGNSFTGILPAMIRTASASFGRQLDELARTRTEVREGRVEIGELEVAGTVVDPPPPLRPPPGK